MGKLSNSQTLSSSELYAAMQLSQMQSLDDEQQKDSTRMQSHETHRYNSERALSHERSEKEAKKEAVRKGHNVSRVRQTQVVKQDSLRTAGEEVGNSLTTAQPKKGDITQKPPMPTPSTPPNLLGGSGGGDQQREDMNVMAIIARVMVLVANTQIKGWKTFWQMGRQNINMSWEMSQSEAANTKDQYAAQSQATKEQADQYGKDGSMQLVNFGMCSVLGAVDMANEEPKEPPSEDISVGDKDTITGRGNDPEAVDNPEDAAADPANAGENADTAETTSDAKPKSWWGKVKGTVGDTFKSFKSASGRASKATARFVGSGYKVAQFLTPGMQGAQQLSVDKPAQNRIAAQQSLQGAYAASATLARGYSEYNNQIYNRQEDLRQQTSQGVDYAMNVYKSASDAMTQAVSAMAR